MITETIKILQKDNYYGGGKYIEIAKGENEYITDWSDLKRKIKRLWESRKK